MKDLVFIFDGDGVAIHAWHFARYLEQECGIGFSTTQGFFTGVFQDCMRGQAELREELEPFLLGWGWQAGYDEFLNKWLTLENAPNHEMLAVVSRLQEQGYDCYLGSNQDKSRARYIESEMGFQRIFKHCFFSTDLGAVKPEAGFFDAVTRWLKLKPEQIVFFDDSASHVSAAKAYGWHSFQCTEVAHVEAALAELGI